MAACRAHSAAAVVWGALASPRFLNALATVIVAASMTVFALRQLIGWAGVIAILAGLVTLSGASLWACRDRIDRSGIPPISLIVLLAWAGLSLAWSQYHWATIAGLASLACFTVLAGYVALVRDTIQIVRVFGDVFRFVIAVSLAIEIVAGVLLDTPIRFLNILGTIGQLGPIQGIMGARNQLGIIAVLALVTFVVELRTFALSRGVAIASLIGATAALLLSRSPLARTTAIGGGLAAAALVGLRSIAAERRGILQVVLLAILAIGTTLVVAFRSAIIEVVGAGGDLGYRLDVWRRVFELIKLKPLQGWGWIGAWRDDIPPFQLFQSLATREENSASGAFLDVWLQLGLVGLALFSIVLILAVTRSWLLASRKRGVVWVWPALTLVTLTVTSFGESVILKEFGWLTFVICAVIAARELSWRKSLPAGDSAS